MEMEKYTYDSFWQFEGIQWDVCELDPSATISGVIQLIHCEFAVVCVIELVLSAEHLGQLN